MSSEYKEVDVTEIQNIINTKLKNRLVSSKAREAVYLKMLIKIIVKNHVERKEYWIFHGRERDYMIIPGVLCTCKDFLIHVVPQQTKRTCYHLEAQALAEQTSKYRILHLDEQTMNTILIEILKNEYSPTLRRILISRK